MTCPRMSLVRGSPPDLCNILHLMPHPPQEIRIENRSPILRREDPSFRIESLPVGQRLLFLFRPQPPQLGRELGAHIDLPLRRLGLRRLHLAVMRDVPTND